MPSYTLTTLSQDPEMHVPSARFYGPTGPTASLFFCVNQGYGLAGVYTLGLTTGSYSRVFSAATPQAVAMDGQASYISTGQEPYEVLYGADGLTGSHQVIHSSTAMVWDLAVDAAAGQLRFTEEYLVRTLPLTGGSPSTLATFSYWMRELAVDPSTGDIWAHAQDIGGHYLLRMQDLSPWTYSVALATSSYIGGLAWSATHSGLVFTCGLSAAGVYSLSGGTATPVSISPASAMTYSAWKAIAAADSGDLFLASLTFGTGETASQIAWLRP